MRFAPFYYMMRWFWRLSIRLFFRRIDVEGHEQVPHRGPILLVPNHTNFMIDPAILMLKLRRKVVVGARTPVFSNPLVRMFLRSMDSFVLPFKHEQETDSFPNTRRQLERGQALVTTTAGVGPIAMDFHEHHADKDHEHQGLKVVPVGIHYENEDRFRSDVWVRFGDPVDIADWVAQNPEKNPDHLREELEQRTQDLTVTYRTRRETQLLELTAEIVQTGGQTPAFLGQEGNKIADRIRLMKRIETGWDEMSESHPERVKKLEAKVFDYQAELLELGITPAEVFLPMHPARASFFFLRELELFVFGLPLALWGLINHWLPFKGAQYVGWKRSKDRGQFVANAMTASIVLFPLFYAIQITIAFLAFPIFWAVIYTVMLPYSGIFAILFFERVGNAQTRSGTFLQFSRDQDLQGKLAEQGREIIKEVMAMSEMGQKWREVAI